MPRVTGSFEVTLNPMSLENEPGECLIITIVPDSGTDQLDGLRGSMSIRIEGGKHFYDLNYTLDAV